MRIASLSKSERPREKAFEKGMEGLSNEELLALILSSGTKQYGALDIATNLLSHFWGLASLSSCPYLLLEREKGVGRAKASILGACFELARRLKKPGEERSLEEEIAKDLLSQKQEALYAYFLGQKGEVLGKRLILLGSLSTLKGGKRALLSSLLYSNEGDLLLVHCHPSGIALPSQEDYLFTVQLEHFSKQFGLRLKDHWIVAENGKYSFRDMGLLGTPRRENSEGNLKAKEKREDIDEGK